MVAFPGGIGTADMMRRAEKTGVEVRQPLKKRLTNGESVLRVVAWPRDQTEETSMRAFTLLCSVALLPACSMTLPVRGQVGDTGETFSGTATGYMDGASDLEIVSNRGATCRGASSM